MAYTTGRHLKTGFADLYDKRIAVAYRQGYGEPEHEFEQFYGVQEINEQDKRWTSVTGFGQWQEKELGANVAYAAISPGYPSIITPFTLALAFTVEEETEEDDPTGLLGQQLATALAESGRETIETYAAQPFNNPTSTAAFTPWQTSTSTGAVGSAPDGVALLSTSHPIVTGGVYANTPSAQCSLSLTALAASKLRLQKMQGSHGQMWPLQGQNLVVPPDLEQVADELLGSPTIPYLQTDTPNVVRKGLTRVTWSRLTGATSWYLFAKKASVPGAKGHLLLAIWRKRPTFGRDNDFDSGDRRYKGRARIGFGAPDWRGVDGSYGG